MTRHIICAAAIAPVARITMVRMMGMFRETNMPRHRLDRPTRPPLFRLARSHARVSAANDREDGTCHEDFATPQLFEQPVDREVTLVDLEPRPGGEPALLRALAEGARAAELLQHDQLGGDAEYLLDQLQPCGLGQMTI